MHRQPHLKRKNNWFLNYTRNASKIKIYDNLSTSSDGQIGHCSKQQSLSLRRENSFEESMIFVLSRYRQLIILYIEILC